MGRGYGDIAYGNIAYGSHTVAPSNIFDCHTMIINEKTKSLAYYVGYNPPLSNVHWDQTKLSPMVGFESTTSESVVAQTSTLNH